ncbi:MAG: hypothetical protein AAFR67_16600, partial [Chloroflexota bacterium]
EEYVDTALDLFHPDGYFIEGNGWDTSYQAVAIEIGNEVLLSGYTDTDNRLRDALNTATDWLVDRINDNGEIDSTGNTRTCWGQEAFLGEPKILAMTSVIKAITYRSLDENNAEWQSGVERVIQWVQNADANSNPCYGET